MPVNDEEIITAVESKDITELQRLLKAGGNSNATNNRGTPALILSCMVGFISVAHVLVKHGADVKAVDPETRWTALHWAAEANDPHLCEMLIERGADVDALGANRITPLHAAASKEARESCAVLIKYGATVDARSESGSTPLWKAAQSNQLGNAQLFLEHGANIEAKAGNGVTPMRQASLNSMDRMCCLLLVYGADCSGEPFYKKLSKKTAAARGGFPDLLMKLIDDEPSAAPGEDIESLRQVALRFGHPDTVATLDATMARRLIADIASLKRSAGGSP